MRFLIVAFLFISSQFVCAQHWELGVIGGGTNYIGDLSNNSQSFYLQETRLGGGAFVRYNPNDWLSLKLAGNYMRIGGEDANSNVPEVVQRNLSFRSSIIDFGLTGEWNITGYQPYGMFQPFSPYLFAGVGFAHFSPQAKLDGQWYNLADLGTEGQGLDQYPELEPYSQLTFTIPFGVGAKYALNDAWNLGLEAGMRFTFTDYLDDVSGDYINYQELAEGNGVLAATLANRTGELNDTEPVFVETGTARGDTNERDWYMFIGVSISRNFISNGLMKNRSRGGKVSNCYK